VAGDIEFCLLGPLLVRRAGVEMAVLPGKQRVLLAALLLRANSTVSMDELAEAMWGSGLPASARATVRNYVKELRKALADTGECRISTVPGGYLMRADSAELDLSRFELLRASARTASSAGAWDRSAAQLRAALSLWRGEALADVPSELLALREVPRLAELRLQTAEACVAAELQLGRHADVIADLGQLAALHPLRERLRALLMLALYREGRQADALAVYQQVRELLVEELGIDPGPELRQLHQQILSADPAIGQPVPAPSRSASEDPPQGPRQQDATVIPHQLPAAIRDFTGRAAELAALTGTPGRDRVAARTVVISAIAGTAGVGKTALALRWAHEVSDQFPDGQLYVNLRGYDPGQPLTAAQALAGFLRALGVAGHDIPAETDERAAMYRSMMAGRRVLVVLDNARSAEQVRPLLSGSAVLVTSRDSLAGLVAIDGAQRLDLDLLPLEDAVRLLRTLIGRRADADAPTVETLARQSARLPLALRVAAELIAARPATPLPVLAVELADQRRRLDLLDVEGDARASVRAVFSWSLQHLDSAAARAFRLLGMHPGPGFQAYAVAALAGITIERTRTVLATLARAHLVVPGGPDRYGMHDLLHAYAAEQALENIAEPERRASLNRLFDHYLQTAARAMDTLCLAERSFVADGPPSESPIPPVADPALARAWLDEHRAILIEVASYTADHGWPGHATRLANSLFRYLEGSGYYPEIVAICGHALRAARRADDLAAEAEALNNICLVDLRQGNYQQAARRLEQALDLHRQTGDLTGQAKALGNLGIICFQRGGYQQAIDYQQPALALYRQVGNRAGECRTLSNLGLIRLRQEEYEEAVRYLLQALALARHICLPSAEAQVLSNLAVAYLRQGRAQQAMSNVQRSLTLFRGVGDPAGEANALNCLGEVFLALSEPGQARAQHADALDLARRIGDKDEQARAHDGLARTHQANSEMIDARRHWEQAHALYVELGAPEASRIRQRLA